MKRLHIAFSALNDMFKLNRVLFVIMLIGLLTSTYMLVYSYGNISAYNTIYSVKETSTLFKFDLRNCKPLDPEEMNKLDLNKYGLVNFCFGYAHYNFAETAQEKIKFAGVLDDRVLQSSEYSHLEIVTYEDNKVSAEAYAGRVQFEGEKDKYSVILPATDVTVSLEYNEATKSFGKINIYGVEYNIIGISHNPNDVIITREAFEEFGFDIDIIKFNTPELVDPQISEEIANYVVDTFSYVEPLVGDGIRVDRPHDKQSRALESHTQGVMMALYIYLASLVAFAFFIDFFTERSMKRYSISLMCGATKIRLIESMLIQNLVLSLGALTLMIPPNLFFSKEINFFANVKYAFVDIGLMALTVIFSTVVLSIPAMFKIGRSSADTLRRTVM